MAISHKPKNDEVIEVVALAMQHMQDGSYMLARRGPHESGAGLWEFPGGKVESGETQQQALVREIREELSFEVEAGHLEFLGQNLHHYPGRDILIYLWKIRVLHRPEFLLVDHDQVQWLLPAELADISLSPGDMPFISLL